MIAERKIMFYINGEIYDGDIVNLTPHSIVLINDEDVWEIPASGIIARMLPIEEESSTTINGWPVTSAPKYAGVIGLPSEPDGNLYIVSAIVGTNVDLSHPIKKFLIGPDTNRTVRDDNGKIIGVKGFISYA